MGAAVMGGKGTKRDVGEGAAVTGGKGGPKRGVGEGIMTFCLLVTFRSKLLKLTPKKFSMMLRIAHAAKTITNPTRPAVIWL